MLYALLALLACGSESSPPTADGAPPQVVVTATVQAGGVDESWATLGNVVALERAELAASAAGTVVQVTVREGDPVGKGDLLLEVDPALAAARADKARAAAAQGSHELDQARRNLDRLKRVDARVLAETDLEEADSRLASLEARQQGLEADAREATVELGRHRVRAPFSGVVTARKVDAGDWVTPGQPVLDLVSAGAVEVHVDAAPELASAIAEGAAVHLQRD